MASSNQSSNQSDIQGNNQGSKGRQGAEKKAKSERGFAAMDPKRQREIASEGGKAAHLSGNAHEFNSEEAREAGRKGGQASGSNQSAGNKRVNHAAKR